MIRSLRRKFILIAMTSLVGTMVVLCTAIGIGNHYITTNRMDHAISLLYQNGGAFRTPGPHSDPSNFDSVYAVFYCGTNSAKRDQIGQLRPYCRV